jgi:hypothetical protein
MKRVFIIIIILLLCKWNYAQTISQLGAWHNNANFVIKYNQNKVITSTTSGIQFIDVSNPLLPYRIVSMENPGSFPMAIEVNGNYAFFGGGMTGYFMIADISNISSPVQVGITRNISGTAFQIAVSGNVAYMTSGDTLYSIDITDKTKPVVIGRIYMGSLPKGLATQGNYAYVGTGSGLKVVNISNPSNLTIVNSVGTGYSRIAPDFTHQRLFVAKSPGFDAISISDPTSPAILFEGMGGGFGSNICYSNDLVIRDGSGSVYAFYVNSSSSRYIGLFNSAFTGQLNGITMKDSVFYASTVNDLHVLKVGYENTTRIHDLHSLNIRVFPNPVTNYVSVEIPNSSGQAKIQLTDISGREIRSAYCDGNLATIDLSEVEPGIYLICISKGNLMEKRLLVRQSQL